MHKSFPFVILASAPFACMPFTSAAGGSGDDLAAALEQIERLRAQNEAIVASNADLAAKVARLEQHAADSGSWLTDARAEEIRGIVTDVLADASARSSLVADGSTAGWDKSRGFHLASDDGSFLLSLKGDAQFRWNMNHRDIGTAPAAAGSPAAGLDPITRGFEFRRARMTFSGHAVDPSITYAFQFANNRTAVGGDTGYLDDAYIQKGMDDGTAFKVGQFKTPFLREDLVSAMSQLAVERSLVNEVFGAGRTQGVQWSWEGEALRTSISYTDAMKANATSATTGAGPAGGVASGQNTGFAAGTADNSFAARLEYKPLGTWKQLKDMQSYLGEETAAMFGVGVMQQTLSNPASSGAESMWAVTADASIELGGLSLLAYGVYREVQLASAQPTRGGGSDDTLEQWGALFQAGTFVSDTVELFARYELGNTETDRYRTGASALLADAEENSLLTVGCNWWPSGVKTQAVKFSADFGYAFVPLVDFNTSGAGYLPDYTAAGEPTSDGQWLVRTQLQFRF